MKTTVLLLCPFLVYCSWRLAIADLWAHRQGTSAEVSEGVNQALRLEPRNSSYLLSRAMIDLTAFNTPDDVLRGDFQKVLAVEPHNSEALMNLGLIEQRLGNLETAERYLLEAVASDRRFKPVWTLTNFYFQTTQLEKMWPRVTQCLAITDPGLSGLARFSADPIFDLCWRAGAKSKEILQLTPRRPGLLVSFFYSSFIRNDWDAALLSFPDAVLYADPSDSVHRDAFATFCSKLLAMGLTAEAVDVWNKLVERGIIQSTKLSPAQGRSLTDPELLFPPVPGAFGWYVNNDSHLSLVTGKGWMQFSFDGRQNEALEVISKKVPVLPGRTYNLAWKSSMSQRTVNPVSGRRTGETGFRVRLKVVGAAKAVQECPDFLSDSALRQCRFTVPADRDLLEMSLVYERPIGAVRFAGDIRVEELRLDLFDSK